MRIANKHARNWVEKREPFKASNLEGKRRIGGYAVYSYKWYMILFYDCETNTWYLNKEGYSPTTKRQISNCRPHARLNEVSHEEIKRISHKENLHEYARKIGMAV